MPDANDEQYKLQQEKHRIDQQIKELEAKRKALESEEDRRKVRKTKIKIELKKKIDDQNRKINEMYTLNDQIDKTEHEIFILQREFTEIWKEPIDSELKFSNTVVERKTMINKIFAKSDIELSRVKPEDLQQPLDLKQRPIRRANINEHLPIPLPESELLPYNMCVMAVRSIQLGWHLKSNTIMPLPPGDLPQGYAPVIVESPYDGHTEIVEDEDESNSEMEIQVVEDSEIPKAQPRTFKKSRKGNDETKRRSLKRSESVQMARATSSRYRTSKRARETDVEKENQTIKVSILELEVNRVY